MDVGCLTVEQDGVHTIESLHIASKPFSIDGVPESAPPYDHYPLRIGFLQSIATIDDLERDMASSAGSIFTETSHVCAGHRSAELVGEP